jgi:hypothetical protein
MTDAASHQAHTSISTPWQTNWLPRTLSRAVSPTCAVTRVTLFPLLTGRPVLALYGSGGIAAHTLNPPMGWQVPNCKAGKISLGNVLRSKGTYLIQHVWQLDEHRAYAQPAMTKPSVFPCRAELCWPSQQVEAYQPDKTYTIVTVQSLVPCVCCCQGHPDHCAVS